jgi:hypothetical protein
LTPGILTKSEFLSFVSLAIIHSYCQIKIVKEFSIESFLDSVNGSSQTQTNLKKLLIESFNEIQHMGLILKKYKLLSKKDKYQIVDHLQIRLVHKTKYIHFCENVNI